MAQTVTSSTKTAMIAKLIAGLIALFGIYLLVRAIMLFAAPSSHWAAPEIRAGNAPGAAVAVVAVDPSFDPFYRGGEAVAPRQDFEDAPETTLNLKLLGRITGEGGSAILKTPDGSERGYGVGEEIMSGVTLEAVNADYIVISQNGALERLTIENRGGVMSVPEPIIEEEDIDTDEINDIDFNPAQFLSENEIKLVTENGRIIGYRITQRTATADLSQYQLQSGDIITAIGGTDITQGRPDFGPLLQEVQRRGMLELTFIRGGQIQNVSFPLE